MQPFHPGKGDVFRAQRQTEIFQPFAVELQAAGMPVHAVRADLETVVPAQTQAAGAQAYQGKAAQIDGLIQELHAGAGAEFAAGDYGTVAGAQGRLPQQRTGADDDE